MKGFFTLLVLAAVAVGLFVTNPTMDDFGDFIRERADERLQAEAGDGAFGRLLSSFGGDLAGGLAARATARESYGLLSIYTLDLDGDDGEDDDWRFVGIAGQFIPVNEPGDDG